ncbi:hypothetical protein HAZT_HAZT002411 [Hyalella azteca]|uniref:Endonuclease/exonuclease/phosphatase domain-containing protein n=1 Tax=Hyalella azteca TaxID=294128 RepID=A0A6A0GXZ8_HYAAZ|nr:hypothetical protein HAZT_HAZT002411 [Hyalella azteca]
MVHNSTPITSTSHHPLPGPGFSPSLTPLLELDAHNTIIMGDFNAHNPAWFSATQDDRAAARGATLINQIDSGQFILPNQDTPTRLPSQGAPSSPDVTLISPHLALDAVWTPLARLNSDHLPISISLDSLNPPPPITVLPALTLTSVELTGMATPPIQRPPLALLLAPPPAPRERSSLGGFSSWRPADTSPANVEGTSFPTICHPSHSRA